VNGIHEVTGSIPVSSTNSDNDFRERRKGAWPAPGLFRVYSGSIFRGGAPNVATRAATNPALGAFRVPPTWRCRQVLIADRLRHAAGSGPHFFRNEAATAPVTHARHFGLGRV
jgi:hypothetical protein